MPGPKLQEGSVRPCTFLNRYTMPRRQSLTHSVTSVPYFWCEIFRRSAECFCCVAELDVLLAKPEVGNLDVTVLVEQQVFKLKEIIRGFLEGLFATTFTLPCVLLVQYSNKYSNLFQYMITM